MVTGIHIPEEEILVDILTRLPVKSFLRFKCVSECWKALISDLYFKRKHLNHAKNKLNFQKFLFDALSPEYSWNEPSMLSLWNPSTSESMVLPCLGSPLQEGMAPDEILALKSGSWRKIDQPSIRRDSDGFTMVGNVWHLFMERFIGL
ncbi:putative F-box protein At3g52320, partial [Capsicum annuum]|uniref:putative F-box protein At3g52320 n=1 Tax=Capsicum annuum TaxID=4072 RepID=UPI001FB06E14